METCPSPQEPALDAAYFEALSQEHTQKLLDIRSVAVTHFYKYLEPEAWNLLLQAQQACTDASQPDAVSALLLDPATGGWLSHLIPYEQADPATGVAPEKDDDFAWHILHGHSIAASAAIQAGVPAFTIQVPAWSGRVTLPGLGQAILREASPTDDTRELATLTATPDAITVTGCDNQVMLMRKGPNVTPTWQETAQIKIDGEQPHMAWGVLLDDTNPYRLTAAPVAPSADIHQFANGLHQRSKADWVDLTRRSMELLVRDHPDIASDLRREIRSIAPLSFEPQAICLRPYSASGSATAGGIEVDFQHFPEVLAASLVHEGAHNRYYGLVLKEPFVSSDWANRPYLNSPWRSDVRPATGHLLGIDAFSKVGEFWQQRTSGKVWLNSQLEMDIAFYEVAFLRSQVELALTQIDADGEVLTEEGQAYIDHVLKPRIDLLQTESVPQRVAEAAQESVDYHIAMWRAHHYELPSHQLKRMISHWEKSENCPNFTDTPSNLVPGTGYYFDLWTTFNRLKIGKPDVFAMLQKNPNQIDQHVQGARPRDLLNFTHKSEQAYQAYVYELTHASTIDPRTIVNFGFALRGTVDAQPSLLLRQYPHVFKGMLNHFVQHELPRPHPLYLAKWMLQNTVLTPILQ